MHAKKKTSKTIDAYALKCFLQDFLKMPDLSDEDFLKIYRNIDSDGTGEITQKKMLSFILTLSGFSELADKRTVRRLLRDSKKKSSPF